MSTEHCIHVCNYLLRRERSALETYDLMLGALFKELARIRDEHLDSITALDANVRSMNGTPDLESDIWEPFVHPSPSDPSSERAAVDCLRNGERNVVKDYENALADESVMPACKELIREVLLPRVQSHLDALKELARPSV